MRKNEKFINNPVFKLLPLINALAYYIQTDEKDFEEFFGVFNAKNKKNFSPKVEKEENNEKKSDNNLLGNKRAEPDNDKNYEIIVHKEEQNGENKKSKIELKQPILARSDDEQENDKRMLDFDDIVNRMMKISKLSREEVLVALYGTSYNIKNAFLYLKDNAKYDKYFFQATDDLVIEKMMDKKYFKDLVDDKGMELIEERKKFLGIK